MVDSTTRCDWGRTRPSRSRTQAAAFAGELGQGKELFDRLECPKEFQLFKKEDGAEGHCEGMAPIVSWEAAFDWLEAL